MTKRQFFLFKIVGTFNLNGTERRAGKDTVRFKSLDGWRGICALLVALFHVPIKDGFLGTSFFNDFYLFVDFFFVLSGFVINHSYGISLRIDPTSGQKFLLSRVARLWPLHIALFGSYVILDLIKMVLFGWYHTASGPPPTIPGLILTSFEQIFLLQALLPSPAGIQWNGQSWSISTEFWTYVLFLFLVVRCYNRVICAASLVALSAFLVVIFSSHGMDVTNWLGYFRCFYGFFAGYLLYELYSSTLPLFWKSKWTRALSTPTEALCIFAVVLFLSVAKRGSLSYFSPLLFAFVIYVFAAGAGGISKLLSGGISQTLGRYSYSIYMTFGLVISLALGACRLAEKIFHVHLIRAISVDRSTGNAYVIHFGAHWEMIGSAGVILVAIVLTSHYTYHYIEMPCQAFVKTFGSKFLSGVQRAGIGSDLA